MLAPFRAEMQMFSRDGGTGVLLYDARKHEYVPTYAELVNGVHDLVGLPKYTGHGCETRSTIQEPIFRHGAHGVEALSGATTPSAAEGGG